MYKKILLSIALFLFCFSNSIIASGFFCEGGIGGRYLNGSMDYQINSSFDNQTDFEMSRDPLIETPLGNSVTDNSGLGWKSNFIGNYNAIIGFQLSEKFVTSLSVHYFGTKAGFGLNLSRSYPDVNADLGENISRNSIKVVENNWFRQITFRATQNMYIDKSLFLIAGIEYSLLNLKSHTGVVTANSRTSIQTTKDIFTYKDNTVGMFAGLGYELPLSSMTSLMITGIYSMSNYNGDELYYKNLEFDIGGLELGYTLRYYLR